MVSVLKELDDLFSLKEEQTTALKAWLHFSGSQPYFKHVIALIGSKSIQLFPERHFSLRLLIALYGKPKNEVPD